MCCGIKNESAVCCLTASLFILKFRASITEKLSGDRLGEASEKSRPISQLTPTATGHIMWVVAGSAHEGKTGAASNADQSESIKNYAFAS